ncbi:MAG: PIN domain-containing protein [bacterium]
MAITLDTHTLSWYLEGSNSKLSEKALKAIKEAERDDIIYISIIVLMELLHLIEKGRINLSFKKIISLIEENDHYNVVDFNMELLDIVEELKGLEAHDRIILATAILTESALISKDKEIRNYQGINIIW